MCMLSYACVMSQTLLTSCKRGTHPRQAAVYSSAMYRDNASGGCKTPVAARVRVWRRSICHAIHSVAHVQPAPRDPKPAEVVHFDTVKEVMDALRGQHPALTASLEAFLTDIGAPA
jgi:hypothetical protein